MFKILYGTAANDISGHSLGEIQKNIRHKEKTYLLVPEQFSVFTERRIIEKFGVKAQTLVEVLTFSRLANEVLGELGPLRLRYVDGAAREIFAARTLQLIEKKLDYFRPNVHQKGFSTLLINLVSEFRRYGHTPSDIIAAADGTDSAELSRKLRDTALFYETYTELINSSASDAEDDLGIALHKIKDYSFAAGSHLIISEFRSFTPLEIDVMTELMKKLEEVSIYICCDDPKRPGDIFRTAAFYAKRLSDAAADAGHNCTEPEKIDTQKRRSADIAYLCGRYFDPYAKKYDRDPKSGHIHILRPESTLDEIETAAAITHKLCRTKNYRQSDILILARDSETYSPFIPAVFESAGINVFMDKRRSLCENPYLVCLSSVIGILAYGFSYERIMILARSGFVPELMRNDVDVFDNYMLAADPGHAMLSSASDWTYNPDKKMFDPEQINKVKHLLLDPIIKLKKSLKGRKTAKQISDLIFSYMDNCGHEAAVRKLCADFANNGMPYLAEEYRAAWNSAVSIISEIGEIMRDTDFTYEKYYELFISACTGIKVGVSPQTVDSTVFSRIDMFRNTGAKAVIVLGTADGVFPMMHGSEGLISDAERELLRNMGLELAMTAAEKAIDENVLVYSVLSTASEEIYFISPMIYGGEQAEPSPIIKRIQELFGLEYEDTLGGLPETKEFALRKLKSELASVHGEAELLSAGGKAVYEYFNTESQDIKDFENRLLLGDKADIPLEPKTVELLYGRAIRLSASKLEKYNSCAFSYFMRYGLVLRPRDKAELDPLEMGNILHKTMEIYFSREHDYDKITREQCRREIRRIVSEAAGGADEAMYSSSAYYKYMIMRMSGVAAATAWETIKFFRVSRFRPIGFEVRIGSEKIPPLRFELENGSVDVEGFIDRVDGAEVNGKHYISIVDYKSSSKKLDKDLSEAGVAFQPLVYMDAYCSAENTDNADNENNTEPAAMLYQQMNDPIVSSKNARSEDEYEKEIRKNISTNGWVVDDKDALDAFDKNHDTKMCFISPRHAMPPEEMKARIENAGKKIARSAEGILSGEIAIMPYITKKYDPCEFCDYIDICAKGE